MIEVAVGLSSSSSLEFPPSPTKDEMGIIKSSFNNKKSKTIYKKSFIALKSAKIFHIYYLHFLKPKKESI